VSDLEKPDPWAALSRFTAARIALGRAGGSVRTETLLDFRLAHARARDAVALPFDAAALSQALGALGIDTCSLATQATDRASFLLNPDLGRRLQSDSLAQLVASRAEWGQRDLCIVVSDGLSALAANRQIVPLLAALIPRLVSEGVSLFPIFVVPFARVKIADELGETLSARHSLILLGERPGLSSPDSLGAYLTFQPRAACSDADRNCVSNIRPEGLPPARAADSLLRLLSESARLGLSGVSLKLGA